MQVNLEWLDLSFNNISKLEGLETLTKLKDLSVFNNNIAKLEGLDTLTSLQVLSVGMLRPVVVIYAVVGDPTALYRGQHSR